MKKAVAIGIGLCALGLGGCQTIGNWADNAGEHLPVINERCEHWECMSDSGKARSDEIKEEQAKQLAKQGKTPAPEVYDPQIPPTPPYPDPSHPHAIDAGSQ